MPKNAHRAIWRLLQDYYQLKNEPIPFITAEPLESDIFEWYFVIAGPSNSAYKGGYYLGKLKFTKNYPYVPPSVNMLTPNGRIKTDESLCLRMCDYRLGSWNPTWTVSTFLMGFLYFMLERTNGGTCTEYFPEKYKRAQARESVESNLRNPIFCKLFPALAKKLKKISSRRKHRSFPKKRCRVV